MARALVIAGILALAPAMGAAYTNAANYLIAEEIAAACEGRPGEIDPGAAIERDLTGDGRADFLLSHEGITCTGAGMSRSSFCGAQVCSVQVYVRRGALLELELDMLGAGVTVGDGSIPPIHMFGHGGRPATLRWDGRAFR